MKKRTAKQSELPWKWIRCFDCESEGYVLSKWDAEAFAELVRRVIDKDDFTSFAKKCQKEIFEK